MTPNRPRHFFAIAQIGTAMIALSALAFWPPQSGAMLLFPVWNGDTGATFRLALDAGVTILGQGPVSGSLVVVGDRARILPLAMDKYMLVVAAPPSGCGNPSGATPTP